MEKRSLHMRKIDGPIPSGSTVNILFLCRLFYPHIGGVEKHVLEISRLLIKKGHRVTVVTEQHEKKIKTEEEFEGIKIYRIPDLKEGWLKKIKIWNWLVKHNGLIKDADIVHCHDVFFWHLPFRFLFFNKPAYTTFHGYESYPLKSKYILMHKIAEKLSMGNICVGDFMKKWYGTKPNFVSYGGVNVVQNSEFKIQNPKKKESAVFIGRLDEQTGIKTYANAVKLIRKKIPDFKFEIIGDGKFREDIEKDFKVLGFQKNPEKYFSKYNFAFVSRYLSILEAMAAKRLVFAVYDNPLKEDYLKLAPFAKYINVVGSKDKISSLIFYFLNHPDKEKIMVDRAFEWVKIQSWDKATKLYTYLWRIDL